VVEATSEKTAAFYRDFGFVPFPNGQLRLFMPASEAMEAISARCRSKPLTASALPSSGYDGAGTWYRLSFL
jgi:hypothetical protein